MSLKASNPIGVEPSLEETSSSLTALSSLEELMAKMEAAFATYTQSSPLPYSFSEWIKEETLKREYPKDLAYQFLNLLQGQDLTQVAPFWRVNPLKNKGGYGIFLEKFLGIGTNNRSEPDGGDWELKTVPVWADSLLTKECMAITMIDPATLSQNFNESGLWLKIQNLLIVSRRVQKDFPGSVMDKVLDFNLDEHPQLKKLIKTDYETIQNIVKNEGFDCLSRSRTKFLEAGTKGSKGSSSRAFYFSKHLMDLILQINRK